MLAAIQFRRDGVDEVHLYDCSIGADRRLCVERVHKHARQDLLLELMALSDGHLPGRRHDKLRAKRARGAIASVGPNGKGAG